MLLRREFSRSASARVRATISAGGAAEFIYPGERIEPKVVRQFGRLLSPALANVRVDWGRLAVTQAPAIVPPVFAGGRLLLYGFLRGDSKPGAAIAVRLTADAPGGPVAFDVPVELSRAESGMAGIARLLRRPPAMHALVALQRADGSWELTPDLAAAIGYERRQLESALTGATGDPVEARAAWATALALSWLEAHAGDAQDQWRRLADKARAWLTRVSAAAPAGATWLDAAGEFLRSAPAPAGGA
ncbi:MAG TPA: hypothetical protein VFP00_10810 [Burkholderiales bacterium]|nr:hypothetical protein [Burkholderiales bacterium]